MPTLEMTYHVECSKIKPPRSGDAADTATEPKWPYFKQMLFLKDIVKPRASSSNLKPKLGIITNGAEREDEMSHQEPDIDLNEAEIELCNRNVTETQRLKTPLQVNLRREDV
ncbi:hypothetical protein J6590_062916 [Homalodisca vitripennis]|nr:hypothetical protein J6590_062916 [Homalodisca vitripennis]